MTREEAREELIEEWNEFIDGCGLRGIEEKEAKRNSDFKKVYEANLMAIQALEQEPKEKCTWIKYDYRTMCPKEHMNIDDSPYWRIPENRMETLKYCPYCGKEIEVEE